MTAGSEGSVSLEAKGGLSASVGSPERFPFGIALILGATVFLAMLPVTMMVPVIKEIVADRFQASTFWAHAFMSINMVAAVLAAPILGAWSDRVQRRKPFVVAATLAHALLLLALPAADSLAGLMAVRFLEGAAHITVITAIMALASDAADPPRRGQMMGMVGSALMFGTACGVPLGGRIGNANAIAVFYVGAGVSVAVAVLVQFFVRESAASSHRLRMAAALQLMRRCPELTAVYAFAFIDRFCVGILVSSFVLFLGQIHGLPPAARGGLLALFLIPFAALCYPVGRLTDQAGRMVPLCVGSLGFGVVFALYGVVPSSAMTLLMLLSGVFSALMFPPTLALCGDFAPHESRAAAYAGFNAAGSLGFLCGPLLGGLVHGLWIGPESHLTAYRITFLFGGASVLVCTVGFLPWLIRLRRARVTRKSG